MREISATDAARNFSHLLDAVERERSSFVVTRKGRRVARIEPARSSDGATLEEILRRHPVDEGWLEELRALRAMLVLEERNWLD